MSVFLSRQPNPQSLELESGRIEGHPDYPDWPPEWSPECLDHLDMFRSQFCNGLGAPGSLEKFLVVVVVGVGTVKKTSAPGSDPLILNWKRLE